jgi:chorismate synthase
MLVRNKDARPQAYDEMKEKFDHHMPTSPIKKNTVFVTMKVGADHQLRETIARVAAGAIAQKILGI